LKKVFKKQILIANFWLLFLMPAVSFAAPGDTLFVDDFDRAGLGPWISSDPAATGILSGGQTSGSNPRGAYTNAQAVTVTSPVIGAAVPAAALSIWIRRGSNQISDGPEAGEDFLIEYQRADLTWGTLAFYPGSGKDGETFIDGFALPADALHNNLVVRLRQTAGSGAGQDFWHFDDVIVAETPMPGLLTVGTCDHFENGISNWTFNTVAGLAGISGATSSSPVSSLFLNGGIVEVVSRAVDTSDPLFTDLTMWILRETADPARFTRAAITCLPTAGIPTSGSDSA
jgi:hypothetical protein